MKKIFLLLLTAIVVASCEGPMGPPGRDGKNAEETQWQIINVTIRDIDWQENHQENLYYSAKVSVPELTPFIRDYGLIQVYRDLEGGYQQVLPFTRHKANGNSVKWTQTVDYEYIDGEVNFYVTNSNFLPDPPEEMYFRIVLIW